MNRPEAANDDMETPRIFIFGCGYSAQRFAQSDGRSLVQGATTRSADKAASLAAAGITPYLFDGTAPGAGIDAALHRATHLILSIAPGEEPEGDAVLRWYRDEILHGAPDLRWIGYLSTVGVYGNHDGAVVDETTPPAPASERSRRRLLAEEAWAALAREKGIPCAILRLSGIYGPGRNAFVNLAEGRAKRLVKPGQVFNRIHVDDISGALALLIARNAGGIWNVTDDEPAPPQDVVAHAAARAGVAPPPEEDFATASLSPMARSFYGENKRVSNAALRRLGYEMRYPTYREGLAALDPATGGPGKGA